MAFRSAPWPLRPLADQALFALRGYARLIFGTRASAGALLLLASLIHAPTTALLGLLAVLVAHQVAGVLGYSRDAVAGGYYGYNALLIGLALGQAQPLGLRLVLLVGAGATLGALLSAVLGDLLRPLGIPLLALPFVVVTSLTWHTTLGHGDVPFWVTPEPAAIETEPLLRLTLEALGAIVFAPSTLSGVLVLAASALESRIATCALLLGALSGCLTARALGVSDPALLVPAGYNAALTSAALGAVFYVPAPAAIAVAAVASATAAWLSLAFMLPFAPLSVPVLAWPFVLITACTLRALGLRGQGRRPHPAPLPHATPEQNLEYARTIAKRLQLPSPPRFALPVQGTWCVTQGVDGPHTHRGPWRHALDFEIVDPEGFPFRGSGLTPSDYYCFGQAVLAPGSGVVVAVHDGAPDNAPGHQDLQKPWGNAVVIQHAPALFSVVAHLRQGSIRVAPGQSVTTGTALGECGSSGRSPRPHLHFQAQASASLGAPTLDFRMVHYAVRADIPRFQRLGVPAQGNLVRAATAGDGLLEPGFPESEQVLVDQAGRRIQLQPEITLLGEHVLVDAERGERLHYVAHEAGILLTALHGSARGALGALLQVAPILPKTDLPRVGFEEELSPEPLLPWPVRLPYQLLATLFDPVSARVSSLLTRSADQYLIESECELRAFGLRWSTRRGRLLLDRHGIATLELTSCSPLGTRHFSANRSALERGCPEPEPRTNEGTAACALYHRAS